MLYVNIPCREWIYSFPRRKRNKPTKEEPLKETFEHEHNNPNLKEGSFVGSINLAFKDATNHKRGGSRYIYGLTFRP